MEGKQMKAYLTSWFYLRLRMVKINQYLTFQITFILSIFQNQFVVSTYVTKGTYPASFITLRPLVEADR